MLDRTEYRTKVPKITENFDDMKTSINSPTGNFFYEPWTIKPEYKGTVWETLLASLPVQHGEARVIVMQPGTTYMAHADIDNRWHLSLSGEQSYLIDLENQKMFPLLQDGYWYYMNAGCLHTASNYGSTPRAQLVVRELLTPTSAKDLIQVTISPSYSQYDYRYKFDSIVSPWLNNQNKKNMIKDFEVFNETVKFKTANTDMLGLKLTDDFDIKVDKLK